MIWSGFSICDISLFVYFAVHAVYILFCLYLLLFLWRRDLYEMAPNKCSLYVCMYGAKKPAQHKHDKAGFAFSCPSSIL